MDPGNFYSGNFGDMQYVHRVPKKRHFWLAIQLRRTSTDFDIFSAGMLPRKQTVKLWFIFPLHLSNASALPGKKRKKRKSHLFTQMLYYCFARDHAVAS